MENFGTWTFFLSAFIVKCRLLRLKYIQQKAILMLFKLAWTHCPEMRNTTIKRFMETGGMPPEGIAMLSRYHNVDGTGGFAICETDDAQALHNWSLDWTDLIKMEITLIMDDESVAGVLGSRAEFA